jgi:RNA polymerase sporulation-specific sigma factor
VQGEARSEVSDEVLVAAARRNEEHAMATLLLRYRGFARAIAGDYFLVGGDHEDLVQEGMIGLYHAILVFDAGRQASFHTFAELCVTRQIITAIRGATRHKHRPLNDYVSVHRPLDEAGTTTLADVLPASGRTDPAEQLLSAERVRDLRRQVDTALTDLEVEVLRLHVSGGSYSEIARTLDRHPKAVDNALQRIRRKLGSHLVDLDADVA